MWDCTDDRQFSTLYRSDYSASAKTAPGSGRGVILPAWTRDKHVINHAGFGQPVDRPYLFEEQDVIRSQQPYTGRR